MAINIAVIQLIFTVNMCIVRCLFIRCFDLNTMLTYIKIMCIFFTIPRIYRIKAKPMNKAF